MLINDSTNATIMDPDYVFDAENGLPDSNDEPTDKLLPDISTITAADSITLSRISPADKFTIDGHDYVKGSVVGGTKRGLSTSWIWNHGIEIVRVSNKKRFWKCFLCKKTPVIYIRTSTNHPMNHLIQVHGLNKEGLIMKSGNLKAAFQKSSTKSKISALIIQTDQEEFRRTLLE